MIRSAFLTVLSIASNRRRQQPTSARNFQRYGGRAPKTPCPVLWVGTPIYLFQIYARLGARSLIRFLLISHYDVIPAPRDGWNSEPFTLTGKNGYLYGRGATDNKGPILAVACAAADLLSRRALGLDLVMLIEGEEECGSIGFRETVQKHKVLGFLL
jgi:di- and tripeptidase